MAINPVDSVKMQPLSGEVIQSVPLQVPANASIAALRAVVEAPSKAVVARTAGWTAALDGDEGEFYWDAASALADDGGSVIKPTVVGGNGRFRRLFRPGAYISVRSFGAKGDGATDDSVAVQAAMTYAVANSHTLFFPGGTYLCNTAINVAGPVAILGEGKGVTILKSTTTQHFFIASVLISASTVSISNLTYTGSVSTSGHALFSASAFGCTDTFIDRVRVTAGGLLDGSAVATSSVRITNCESTSANTYLTLILHNTPGDLFVTGNSFNIGGTSTASIAIQITGSASAVCSVLIQNNTVRNYGTFFLSNVSGSATLDFALLGNVFSSVGLASAAFYNVIGSLNPTYDGVLIEGNTIQVNTPPAGGVIGDDGISAGSGLNGYLIIGNTITSFGGTTGRYLISVFSPSLVYISANRLTGAGGLSQLINFGGGGGTYRVGRNLYTGSTNPFTGPTQLIVRWDSNFIDISDFGAIGNAIADDTAAIQAAVTVAINAFLPVRIPGGTYKISGTITASVSGGGSLRVFCDNASQALFQTISSIAPIFTVTVAGGSVVQNVDFDNVYFSVSGTTRTAGAYVGLTATAAAVGRARFNNCTFENPWIGVQLSGLSMGTVTDCKFTGIQSVGVKVVTSTTVSAKVIQLGNVFTSAVNSATGISIDALNGGVIDDNYFALTGTTTIGVQTTAALASGLLVLGTGNSFEGSGSSLTRYSLFSLANIANGVLGTNTNDSASVGVVGEILSQSIAVGAAVALTTAVAANVATITLTAGDWEVEGVLDLNQAGTTTISLVQGGSSSTSATLGAQDSFITDGAAVPAGLANIAATVPKTQFKVAAGATLQIWLVAKVSFAVSTCAAYGTIRARRVR